MPTYDFVNNQTGERFSRFMKNSEREQFLADNPHIQQSVGAPALGDPVRLGIRKDGGFKEVLQKIHSRTPGSRLNRIADI